MGAPIALGGSTTCLYDLQKSHDAHDGMQMDNARWARSGISPKPTQQCLSSWFGMARWHADCLDVD